MNENCTIFVVWFFNGTNKFPFAHLNILHAGIKPAVFYTRQVAKGFDLNQRCYTAGKIFCDVPPRVGGGGHSHIERSGVVIVSLRSINRALCSYLSADDGTPLFRCQMSFRVHPKNIIQDGFRRSLESPGGGVLNKV